MKNLKSFAERHIFAIALLEAFVLGPVGVILGVILNRFWFLLAIFALLLYLLLWRHCINKDWVCTKCGVEAVVWRYKFCSACGGLMGLKKKEKRFCPRKHGVSKYDRFCPKCGVHLITGRFR